MEVEEMRSATGVREPLSNTITSRAGSVCAAIESRQARSMSPPSISRTMTETSLMTHPVEVRASVNAAERNAAGRGYVHRQVAVLRSGRRKNEGLTAHFDRRAGLRLIANRR